MKVEQVKVGMVVFDKGLNRYIRVEKYHLLAIRECRPELKRLRPLTKKEKGD